MFKIEFSTGNAAFHADDPTDKWWDNMCRNTEIKNVLKNIINQLENGKTEGSCVDINGNRVGTWSLTD